MTEAWMSEQVSEQILAQQNAPYQSRFILINALEFGIMKQWIILMTEASKRVIEVNERVREQVSEQMNPFCIFDDWSERKCQRERYRRREKSEMKRDRKAETAKRGGLTQPKIRTWLRAMRLFGPSFDYTSHSFACSVLLNLLAHSVACTYLLAPITH